MNRLMVIYTLSELYPIMPSAISFAKRQKIIQRRQGGQAFQQIAQDLGLSKSGVKKIWYAYRKVGAAALENQYGKAERPSLFDDQVRQRIEALRDNNQGADYIVSKYRNKYPDEKCPSARTLQRWWKKQGSNLPRGGVKGEKKKLVPAGP